MVYKRYIKKRGKKLGPYYYYNIKKKNGVTKSLYLGTEKPSPLRLYHLMVISFFFLIVMGGILFLSSNKILPQLEPQTPSISIDQLLIKILLKERESIIKDISIMNTDETNVEVKLSKKGLTNMVNIEEDSFYLNPGETKKININISSQNPLKSISYSPGIYVGSLIITTKEGIKKTPIIIEIESKNILFDMNINFNAQDRIIELGQSKNIEIRLFNLGKISPANVLMEYNIMDLNGETIFTETETVVVTSQVSFYKTINIPFNLNTGQYVYNAKAIYGNSIGTSSYLFEVKSVEVKKTDLYYNNISKFLNTCSNSKLCLATLIGMILIIFLLGSYTYFFIGAYIYSKINKNFLHTPTYDFKLKRIHKEHPIKHHKVWPFILIAFILSITTVAILYYKNLFPKIIIYLQYLKSLDNIDNLLNYNSLIYIIIGAFIILAIAFLIYKIIKDR